jgi:5-methylcytosine-specific restriction endonuclease McrA
VSLIESNRWEWSKVVARVKRRDGYACRQCGSLLRLEVDHIVPRRLGGTDDDENLRTLCHDCHVNREFAGTPVKRNPLMSRGSLVRRVW